MISVNIKIVDINYEQTLQQIFPVIKEKLNAVEQKNMLIRLFQKLDGAALPVLPALIDIMNRLAESTKNELLVMCMNTYSAKVKEVLNEELMKHPYGKYLTVGTVSIVYEREAAYFWLEHIQVDYKELVKEKATGKFGNIASFVGKKLEKVALKLLWTEESKQKLIEKTQATLDKCGFAMRLADIHMKPDTEEPVDAIESEKYLELTDEIETDILDALVGFLKERMLEYKEGEL